jgi:hypothetical protein
MVPVQGAGNVAPLTGELMETVGGRLVCVAAWTVTDAVMNGCTTQWYGKAPADLKVKEKVEPWGRMPESHTPVSLVDECTIDPAQVQVTTSFA